MTPHQIAARGKFIDRTIPDPGTGQVIAIDRHDGVVPIVTGASGETNTLAAPFRAGINTCITMRTDGGGDRVITPTGGFLAILTAGATFGANLVAATTMTFNDVNDTVWLTSLQTGATTFQWVVKSSSGVTLA